MFHQLMKFCLTRSNIRLLTGLISRCLEQKTLHLCDFWTENLSAHWRGANQHKIGPNILIPFLWNVIMNTIWNEIRSTFWSEIKTNLKMEWFSFRSHNVVFLPRSSVWIPFQFSAVFLSKTVDRKTQRSQNYHVFLSKNPIKFFTVWALDGVGRCFIACWKGLDLPFLISQSRTS